LASPQRLVNGFGDALELLIIKTIKYRKPSRLSALPVESEVLAGQLEDLALGLDDTESV
jgi:hypothetical protein